MSQPCYFCDTCGLCIPCGSCRCEAQTMPTNPPPSEHKTDPPGPADPLERIAITLDNILGEVRGLRADVTGLAGIVNDHEERLQKLEGK